VTGATGLLGQALVHDARARHDVVALLHRRGLAVPGVATVHGDIADPVRLPQLLDEAQPAVVINTAALVRPDDCEADPDRARTMNEQVPGAIAAWCAANGSALVHISTDAVYGPTDAPFREDTEPRPAGVYARTKLAGELAVLSALPTAAVLRVNFFGWSSSGSRSLAEFFLAGLRAGTAVPGFQDVEFSPLYQRDLADIVLQVIDTPVAGVRNAGSCDALTKYRFGRLVAEVFGYDPELVRPASRHDAGLVARRSAYLTMDSGRLAGELGRRLPTAAEGVQRMHDDGAAGFPQLLADQMAAARPRQGSTL
jgi:dTDP-4-dehydrorhamnose reductase